MLNKEILDKIQNHYLFSSLEYVREIVYDDKMKQWIVAYEVESITKRLEDEWLKFCKDNNLLDENILVIDSNLTKRDRKNIYGYNYFLNQCRELLNVYPEYGMTDYRITKNKRYNCFNNAPRAHRKILFNLLKDNDLLKYGIVSYRKSDWYTTDNPYYREDDPIFLDEMNSDDMWQDFRWVCFNKDYVNDSYVNVVTETYPDCNILHIPPEGRVTDIYGDLFITEKTCKALISQPFIVVGNHGTLKKLREWGFETYPELFDESYDLIEDGHERIKFIFEEVKKLCFMDIKELKEIYKSVIWKIKHNRDVMKNFKKDEFIGEMKENHPVFFGSEYYINDTMKFRQKLFNRVNNIK